MFLPIIGKCLKQMALTVLFAGTVPWVSALEEGENHWRMSPKQILKHIKKARSHAKPMNSAYLAVGLRHILVVVVVVFESFRGSSGAAVQWGLRTNP